MNADFPDDFGKFIKASDFQDTEIQLIYKGWEKKANDDDPAEKKNAKTWKQKIKYQLRYSYPEFATDETGDQILGDNGEPFRNRYFDPEMPKGYSILYYFEEGTLESGSPPLFRAFCRIKPKEGERISISRSGKDKETKWSVRRIKPMTTSGVSRIQISEEEMEIGRASCRER